MNSEAFLYKFSLLLMCGLSTSAGNLLNFFFATCNNRPVQVICCAGKRLEITVYKQENDAAMGILVSALIARP